MHKKTDEIHVLAIFLTMEELVLLVFHRDKKGGGGQLSCVAIILSNSLSA